MNIIFRCVFKRVYDMCIFCPHVILSRIGITLIPSLKHAVALDQHISAYDADMMLPNRGNVSDHVGVLFDTNRPLLGRLAISS